MRTIVSCHAQRSLQPVRFLRALSASIRVGRPADSAGATVRKELWRSSVWGRGPGTGPREKLAGRHCPGSSPFAPSPKGNAAGWRQWPHAGCHARIGSNGPHQAVARQDLRRSRHGAAEDLQLGAIWQFGKATGNRGASAAIASAPGAQSCASSRARVEKLSTVSHEEASSRTRRATHEPDAEGYEHQRLSRGGETRSLLDGPVHDGRKVGEPVVPHRSPRRRGGVYLGCVGEARAVGDAPAVTYSDCYDGLGPWPSSVPPGVGRRAPGGTAPPRMSGRRVTGRRYPGRPNSQTSRSCSRRLPF